MKITNVGTMLLSIPFDDGGSAGVGITPTAWNALEIALVRIDTDAGLTGWGEGFGYFVTPATKAVIDRLIAPALLGTELNDPAGTCDMLQRKLALFGRHGITMFAISGVDIALWDLHAKAADQPLHDLLGGAARRMLPSYASLVRYGTPDLAARQAGHAAAEGWDILKLHETDMAGIAACAAAAPGARIIVDVNGAWTPQQARAALPQLAEMGVMWLEEPVFPPEDAGLLASLRGDVPMWHLVWEVDRIEEFNIRALGILDMLCWDVKSRKAQMPVYQLLGGNDPKVPAYASTVTWPTLEEYEYHIKLCQDVGFKAFKLHAWGDVDRDIELSKKLREWAGPDADLMFDGSAGWDYVDALKVGQALEDLGFLWYEEPMRDFHLGSYRKLAVEGEENTIKVDLTTGECLRAARMVDNMRANGSLSQFGAFEPGIVNAAAENKLVMMIGPTWYGEYVMKPTYGLEEGRLAVAQPPRWEDQEEPLAWSWGERVNNDPYYATDDVFDQMMEAAQYSHPGYSSLRFDIRNAWSKTVGSQLAEGQTLADLLPAFQEEVVNLAKVSGYTVEE